LAVTAAASALASAASWEVLLSGWVGCVEVGVAMDGDVVGAVIGSSGRAPVTRGSVIGVSLSRRWWGRSGSPDAV
jgi:hypothetical protein